MICYNADRIIRYIYESTAKSLQKHRGDAGNAEFRGGFLLKFSAFALLSLRLRGEIDLLAVESSIQPQNGGGVKYL